MQQMWSDIDAYIESHLIPEDPILIQTLKNTEDKGFPD
ncbi:methyltransferase, partial [Acinetobacter sp. ULE_I080]